MRNRQFESLGSLEIDNQLEFSWLLDRQIGSLHAIDDLVHQSCGAAIKIGIIHTVGKQSASIDEFARNINRRQPMLPSKIDYELLIGLCEGIDPDDKCVRALTACVIQCRLDV